MIPHQCQISERVRRSIFALRRSSMSSLQLSSQMPVMGRSGILVVCALQDGIITGALGRSQVFGQSSGIPKTRVVWRNRFLQGGHELKRHLRLDKKGPRL